MRTFSLLHNLTMAYHCTTKIPHTYRHFRRTYYLHSLGSAMYCLGTVPNSIPSIWKMETVGSFESMVHIYKITLLVFIFSIMRTLNLTIVNPIKVMHVGLSTL